MPLALLKSKRISRLTARHSRLPLDFQILFLNRLATLLEKGYPLVEALRLITLDPKQGEIARKVQHDLINGHAIESIFKQLGFSNIVTSFLYLSRSTGQLDSLLKKCSRILNQQKQYKDHLKKVLRYPFLLMFLLLSIMTFLHLSLLPSLQHFYQSFHGSEINGTLKIIYSFTDWIFKWLYILCITAAFLFVLWKWIKTKLPIDQQIRLYSMLPVIRKIKRVETTYLFSFHLSLLLKNGSTIKSALAIMKDQNHVPVVARYAEELSHLLYEGKKIHEEISSYSLFEPELSFIFRRSLEKGHLEKDLFHYAGILMDTLENSMMRYISIIQPSLFVFFGSLIIAIYFSIFYPLFKLIQTI